VAGNPGVTPTGVLEHLAARGITISEKTLYKWLGQFVEEGRLVKRDGGKYEAAQ
jgi:Fe2+ or Zn2+ uptake regulation protein